MTGPATSRAASPAPILLVDDEREFLLSCEVVLGSAGLGPVVTVDDGRRLLPLLAEREAAAIVLDLTMPHVTGEELLKAAREEHPQIPVIVVTGVNDVETAVACMRAGAYDYLVKPMEGSRFVGSVRRALEVRALQDELSSLKGRLLSVQAESDPAFSRIVTASDRMRAIFRYVGAIARTVQPVLITGETGVGKELVAQAVHDLSGRAGKFVAVNAAGLDDAVFSDTLFGHRKGAYTGAVEAREGLIAQASGGTLFLDEIGDLKESSQVKLLRLIEDRTYYPLGSDVPRRSDVRVVCATSRDPQALSSAGTFRKDLYYRLAGHRVHIPPLRERPEDMPALTDHFLEEAAASLRRKKPVLPPEALALLSVYQFPGNVRELKTMVFNAVAQHPGGILPIESFRQAVGSARSRAHDGPRPDAGGAGAPLALPGRFPTLGEAEEFLVAEALKRSRNNQGVAASLLGISRQALNKRLVRKSRSSA